MHELRLFQVRVVHDGNRSGIIRQPARLQLVQAAAISACHTASVLPMIDTIAATSGSIGRRLAGERRHGRGVRLR